MKVKKRNEAVRDNNTKGVVPSYYIDWDADTQMWGLFDDNTGFCYGLSCEKDDIEELAVQLDPYFNG